MKPTINDLRMFDIHHFTLLKMIREKDTEGALMWMMCNVDRTLLLARRLGIINGEQSEGKLEEGNRVVAEVDGHGAGDLFKKVHDEIANLLVGVLETVQPFDSTFYKLEEEQ